MPWLSADEDALTAAILRLASQCGRSGDRRTTALLRGEGRHVNHKPVERIWRREGLKVPDKHSNSGSMTDPASASDQAGQATSGPTTASKRDP